MQQNHLGLEDFLKCPTKKSIAVFGDYILDEYWMGSSSRISPEAPVPVIKHHSRKKRHGGVGNVIMNLYHMGADVRWVSCMPSDNISADLASVPDSRNMPSEIIRKWTFPQNGMSYNSKKVTPQKIRIVSDRQQVARYDIEDDKSFATSDLIEHFDRNTDYIENCSAIVISDYNKGFLTDEFIEYIIAYGRKNEIPVLVDTKRYGYSCFKGATTLTPNKDELYRMVNYSGGSVHEALKAMKDIYDLDFATVTLSEEGIMVWDGNEIYYHKSDPIEVYDVTGAGDSSLAALAVGIANNMSYQDAIHLANMAGTVAVQHLGTYYVGIEDLQNETQSTVNTTIKAINKMRSQGKSIVFTNGCFDLLHPGHLDLLREAKEQGDYLVVGINSDASVKRNKGPNRPVMSESQRAEMLMALEMVDKVIIFDEDTPLETIKNLSPDVLVKGEDWTGNVVGSEYVSRVHIVKFKKDIHTSGIIDKITK
jgi:D-beta-D-heptose 7-phosphate kinase/D-beta-D-heptose 1-phosphate adenosyltransferase